MSFLDLFKKKPKGPRINVRVWMNNTAKEKACTKMALKEKSLIFIAWSKVTCQHFQELFNRQDIPNEVITASDILPSRMTGKSFVFLERHYDHDKENKFLASLGANEFLAHLSLHDPLLSVFNTGHIQNLMTSMGHDEGEFIEHEMIDKSIERAMEKIKNSDLQGDVSTDLIEWIEGID